MLHQTIIQIMCGTCVPSWCRFFKLIIMTIATSALIVLIYVVLQHSACGDSCPDGRLCPTDWKCCEQGCCLPTFERSRTRYNDTFKDHVHDHPWYAQWPVLFLLGILGGILICCMWFCICKRYPSPQGMYAIVCSCCMPARNTEIDSAGSLYLPPHYSRCGSFHQAPPPYSEVQSKPDLYPLVITCAEGDGKAGGNYLMVHYFRNYVIRPPTGSLSGTSTAESLNSSFICNATNEANSIIPPPYSCASNYEECSAGCGRGMLRSVSELREAPRRPAAPATPSRQRNSAAFRENLLNSPVQPLDPSYDLSLELLDCEMYCDGGCKPRVGTSPTIHQSPSNLDNVVYEHESYGLRHLFHSPATGTCESPPQPTSPTQTSQESSRRPSEDRRQRRLEALKRNIRKSSLYMPLTTAHPARPSRISPGTRTSSRSAPATPCSNLVPNLLNFTHRVSTSRLGSRSSRLEEEFDPLLSEPEQTRTDHKF